MEQRALGRSGLVVSRLALGTMLWGNGTDAEDAAVQLDAFVAAGGTLVDTADVYAAGASEQMLGRLLREVVDREQVLVATKAFLPTGTGAMRGGSSRGHLLSALDASLRRLELEYVDLWQLHSWDDRVPLEETLAAVDTAVSSGRVRYAGLSNFTGWQTAQAATWQRAWPGRTPLVSTQMEYNLLERRIEQEVLPACRSLGLGVLVYSPLAGGILTGKYRHATPSDSRATAGWEAFDELVRAPEAARVVEAVVTAAEGLGTSPLAVALAWLRDHEGVSAAIVGPRTAGQLQSALAAESLTLPAEIRAALDDVSAPPPGFPTPWP